MDARDFDGLTRSIVASRRGAIVALLAGALGMWLSGDVGEAAAVCGRVGYACPVNTKCCAGALCENGRCRCRRGLKECNGQCAELDSDQANCGACDVACGPGEVCRAGRCTQ